MNKIILVLTIFIFSNRVFAAACCGGSSAMPSLLTGDDKVQVTGSINQGSVLANVDSTGKWKHQTFTDESSSFRLDGATLVTDLWQLGLGLPMTSRHLGNESSPWHLGDLSLSLGYEALPEWDYSAWRPHGIGFLQVTAPTGASLYDGNPETGLNISGKGFWNLAVGAFFSKTFGNWDVNLTPEVHHSLNRKDQDSNLIKPGWGRSLSIGAGWNKKDFRVGAGLTALREDALQVEGAIPSSGAEQKVWTGLLSFSYLWSPELSTTLSYTNQSLFGDPSNTPLGQAVTLSLQQRWPR